jgi:hypothetical protein
MSDTASRAAHPAFGPSAEAKDIAALDDHGRYLDAWFDALDLT